MTFTSLTNPTRRGGTGSRSGVFAGIRLREESTPPVADRVELGQRSTSLPAYRLAAKAKGVRYAKIPSAGFVESSERIKGLIVSHHNLRRSDLVWLLSSGPGRVGVGVDYGRIARQQGEAVRHGKILVSIFEGNGTTFTPCPCPLCRPPGREAGGREGRNELQISQETAVLSLVGWLVDVLVWQGRIKKIAAMAMLYYSYCLLWASEVVSRANEDLDCTYSPGCRRQFLLIKELVGHGLHFGGVCLEKLA